jgi:ferric-dicitrate binding protein FerR (iron transport regulator)
VDPKISELIIKQLRGELTGEERIELDAWLDASPENKALYEELTTEEALAKEVKDVDGIKSRILQTIYRSLPELKPVIPMYRRPAFKWIAAACIILLLGIATFTVVSKRSEKSPAPVAITHDVPAPTNTRAVITLADGSKVYLDSVNNGTIAQENNVSVVKNSNGGIVYSPDHQITGSPIAYNTLFNPRGSKVISLTLSDGTRVWLNSESSLRYPASFASTALNREVEITGEAYFEVKHDAKQPFKVHLPNGSVIEDIGTAFNVNAYFDEADIKTTLIEGSVRVSNGSPDHQITRSQILKPGQQSVQNPSNPVIRVQDNVDVEEVTSWKNGRFQFTDASIETILKEISRYYDAEIVYKDKIPGEFVADISRDVPVSKLLHILELTNRVHFKIEGKKITVMK